MGSKIKSDYALVPTVKPCGAFFDEDTDVFYCCLVGQVFTITSEAKVIGPVQGHFRLLVKGLFVYFQGRGPFLAQLLAISPRRIVQALRPYHLIDQAIRPGPCLPGLTSPWPDRLPTINYVQ